MGVHTVTYYVNVYSYREILFYVDVIICDYYISQIYRAEHSPMIIGEVVLYIKEGNSELADDHRRGSPVYIRRKFKTR